MEVLNIGGMGLHSWLIGVSTTRTQVVQLPIAQLVVQMDITMIELVILTWQINLESDFE